MKKRSDVSTLISILYVLQSDNRMRILDTLFGSDENGLSFKNIVLRAELSPTTTAYHLKILQDSLLIEKTFKNILGRRDYSFYHLTEKGEEVYLFIWSMNGPSMERRKREAIPMPVIHVTASRYGPRCIRIRADTLHGSD